MSTRKRTGGRVPYGYKRSGNGFTLHPEEAPVRKLIFDLFLTYKRKLTVANELNSRGYRTRSGALFSDTSITRFLTDPIVVGHQRENFIPGKGKNRYREPLLIR